MTASRDDRYVTRDVSIELIPTDVALHRLLSVLYRKRAVIERLEYVRLGQRHRVSVRLRVRREAWPHVLMILEREVVTLAVCARS